MRGSASALRCEKIADGAVRRRPDARQVCAQNFCRRPLQRSENWRRCRAAIALIEQDVDTATGRYSEVEGPVPIHVADGYGLRHLADGECLSGSVAVAVSCAVEPTMTT